MESTLDFKSFILDFYQILSQLDVLISNSGLNKLQQGLIKIRTSQINSCDFCEQLHTYDALQHSEDPKRISMLSSWREAKKWFSREEQLILALLEEVTTVSGGLSSEIYNSALDTFGKEKTSKLIMAVANINGWNRISVLLNTNPFA
ncbi:AhpD family alkylhydroperoxidase [Flavobacterium sp. 2755]|uniref:carboxymuconolactone decarboxylase family protein n=1 Tax=Flavobacterium sp. 2755 TaxID=2817765 RepID=UPI0028621831|nr:carboxymuconolactone decarboxylase family protein [Flavobacterium sp. 2755]MDR6762029.1 AhpD family alkylhydroperoxidase [Flavobacterium sp. 2755]